MPAAERPVPVRPRLPVLAEVVRSGIVESVHHGSVVVLGPDGGVRLALGDVRSPMLPRSSNKLAQAAAMLRSGLDLDGELLALAAASHSGESFHLAGVRRILAGVGLSEADLQNTPDLPYDENERRAWWAAGRPATAIAQNCSGKHAAMLATCVTAGWDRAGYLGPGHPLQQAVAAELAALAGGPVGPVAVDGCGAPAHGLSLVGLAGIFRSMAVAAPDTPPGRVVAAVRAHPQWLGGTNRDVTALIRAVPGIIAKDGAEAVYAAALADGTAVAVKIADGGQRARPVVLAEVLAQLGVPADDLAPLRTAPVLGHGRAVGQVRAVRWAELLAAAGTAAD